ncbi:MAG: acetyltransferase [Caryophanon sp.]|nr:acetyltransferase [Caryophanon sp.]
MRRFILIGDSGHSKVITDCITSNGDQVIAKLDDKYTERFEGEAIIKGPLSLLDQLLDENVFVVIAIGSNKVRKLLVEKLHLPLEHYGTVIHKSAIVSESAQIGYGTVVMPSAIINADAKIGNHCIINSSAIVEHDNCVNDYVHISPNTTLTGNVRIGEGTQVGAASVVIPGVEVGVWTMIGGGSTVVRNIEDHVTAVGNPAKVIKKEGLLK